MTGKLLTAAGIGFVVIIAIGIAAYETAPAPAQAAVETIPPAGTYADENVAKYLAFLERLSREAREAREREPVVYWVTRDADSGTWRPAPGPIAPEQK